MKCFTAGKACYGNFNMLAVTSFQNAPKHLEFSWVQVNKYSKYKVLRLTFISFYYVSLKFNAISQEILHRYTCTITLFINIQLGILLLDNQAAVGGSENIK